MSTIDPELPSDSSVPPGPAYPAWPTSTGPASTGIDPPPLPPARTIPNFGHMVLFFAIVIVSLIVASVAFFAVFMALHLLGRETPEQLLREPRLLIPSMAVAYLAAGAVSWALFSRLWHQPFAQALAWNGAAVRRRWKVLIPGGVVLSIAVQFLSNYLPIPKSLPIDDFFRTTGDVWMVALFGTFVAPIFEELAFRGFLLPALASACDWLRMPQRDSIEATAPNQRRWSVPALIISCSLTSVAFALVHADQLAHAWAPLAVLFIVSLVLCTVRLVTRSLAASALVHATYNGTIFSILFVASDGFRHLDKIN